VRLGRALRSPSQVWGAWVIGLVFILIGLASLQEHMSGQATFFLLLGTLFIVFGGYRSAVWVTRRGLRVRNPFRSFEVSWEEVKAFRLGRHRFLPACLLVDLKRRFDSIRLRDPGA
jgi:hypothetical protein